MLTLASSVCPFLSSKEARDPDQLYSTLRSILQQVKVGVRFSSTSRKCFEMISHMEFPYEIPYFFLYPRAIKALGPSWNP